METPIVYRHIVKADDDYFAFSRLIGCYKRDYRVSFEKYDWFDGPLIEAMRAGDHIEIFRFENLPDGLARRILDLNSTGILEIPECPEKLLVAAEGFKIVLASSL